MFEGVTSPQEGMAIAQQRLAQSSSRIASMVPHMSGPSEGLAPTPAASIEAAPASYVPPLHGPPVALLRESVNLAAEAVNQVQAISAFRANATVFHEIAVLESSAIDLAPDHAEFTS